MAVVIVELTPFLSALHALSRVLRIKWFQWLVFGAKVADGLAVAHPTVGPCPHARHQGIQQVRGAFMRRRRPIQRVSQEKPRRRSQHQRGFFNPAAERRFCGSGFVLPRTCEQCTFADGFSVTVNKWKFAPPWEAERGRSWGAWILLL